MLLSRHGLGAFSVDILTFLLFASDPMGQCTEMVETLLPLSSLFPLGDTLQHSARSQSSTCNHVKQQISTDDFRKVAIPPEEY